MTGLAGCAAVMACDDGDLMLDGKTNGFEMDGTPELAARGRRMSGGESVNGTAEDTKSCIAADEDACVRS